MPPNSSVLEHEEFVDAETEPKEYKYEIVWKKVIFFIYLHYGAAYGLYYFFSFTPAWQTWIWTFILTQISTQGTGAGAHRLWAHKTYKARLPLRILLALYQTITFQKDIYDWVRDHRIHHQYSDTDSDPHNASRGFWYSHMGWLVLKKSEAVVSKGKALDLSDLEADPVVMFQRKHYWTLAPILAFLMPAWVGWYFWNENFHVSWCCCNMLRYFLTFHTTCLVNSAAHLWGNRPYDKNILPVENMLVTYLSNGEGFHNYHHTFPWDYKAAELGSYNGNLSTAFIDFMARIGWAYDLKTVSPEMIERRSKRTGDGSRSNEAPVWGWGDKNMKEEDVKMTRISYRNRKSAKG